MKVYKRPPIYLWARCYPARLKNDLLRADGVNASSLNSVLCCGANLIPIFTENAPRRIGNILLAVVTLLRTVLPPASQPEIAFESVAPRKRSLESLFPRYTRPRRRRSCVLTAGDPFSKKISIGCHGSRWMCSIGCQNWRDGEMGVGGGAWGQWVVRQSSVEINKAATVRSLLFGADESVASCQPCCRSDGPP